MGQKWQLKSDIDRLPRVRQVREQSAMGFVAGDLPLDNALRPLKRCSARLNVFNELRVFG
jgi:hypothetical protein